MDSSFSWRSCRVCENPVKTKTYWIFDYSFQILGLPNTLYHFFLESNVLSRPQPFCSTSPPISHITLGTPCFNQGCGLRPSATPEKVWDCTIFLCDTVDGSEIRRTHQLSLVVYSHYLQDLLTSERWLGVWDFSHQHYDMWTCFTTLFVHRPFWWDSRPKGVPEGGRCHCGWWIVGPVDSNLGIGNIQN